MTDAQQSANVRNAKKSTGPRTAAGKQRSRSNGLRHGLRADIVVLEGIEDAGEWKAHCAALTAAMVPKNYLEEMLVELAALALWKLRRAARCERAQIAHRLQPSAREAMLDSDFGEAPETAASRKRNFIASRAFPSDELLARYETTAERSLHRTLDPA